MKSRTSILLFCALALVHFAAQFILLYLWLDAYDQDDIHYDAAKFFIYGDLFRRASFPVFDPASELGAHLPVWIARLALVVFLALNSALWSTIVCAPFHLVRLLFRARPPRIA